MTIKQTAVPNSSGKGIEETRRSNEKLRLDVGDSVHYTWRSLMTIELKYLVWWVRTHDNK